MRGVLAAAEEAVDLGALWCRPWYRLAAVLLRERADVMVHDPDASEVEVYSDGIGTITVVPSVALGWAIVVHEAEPDDEDAEEAG